MSKSSIHEGRIGFWLWLGPLTGAKQAFDGWNWHGPGCREIRDPRLILP